MTRRGFLLFGLGAAVCLAVVAATVTPGLSPLPRDPLPASVGVAGGVAVAERPERSRPGPEPSRADSGGVAAPRPEAASAPTATAVPDRQLPSPEARPVATTAPPKPPTRDAPTSGGGKKPPAPVPSPAPAPVAPAPPAEAAPPPEAPPPEVPEAVISTDPGQGNAYGKGNGNGPPGGVPPGQVGR